MNARTAISEDDEARIAQAITEAEKKTSAEIVCALATESGRYDRAESVVGLLFGLVGLAVAHASSTGWVLGVGEWTHPGGVSLMLQCLAMVAGFIAGSFIASYCHPLRAWFVPAGELDAEVWRGASQAFMRRRADVASGGAVVIYASLFERRIVVVAGKEAAEALGDSGLRDIRDAALDKLRRGQAAAAFLDAVARASTLLAYAFPPKRSNPDELPNRVMIFHPRP